MKLVLKRNELTVSDWPGNMLRFCDFTGVKTKFNMNGDRTFKLELDEANADLLSSAGWRVQAKEVNDDVVYTMKVNVNYRSKVPPTIHRLVDGTQKMRQMRPDAINPLDDISRLDNDAKTGSIISADLVINGWRNPDDGKVTAFLSYGGFLVQENEVISKWSNFELVSDDGEVPFM